MEQILLINPKARSKKMARKTRRKASPAQRAARAKFAAMARSRRRNPAPRRAKRRSNPRVRHHYLTAPHVSHRRRTHRRRNPINTAGMKGLLMPAIKGAAGAVLVDAAFNFIPLPAMLTTGTMGMITKAGAAVLLGTMGRKAFGHSATDMAIGSLTVQTYGLLRQLLPASITGLGYIAPAQQVGANVPPAIASPVQSAGVAGMGGLAGVGMYLNHGMSEYVN